MSPTHDHDRITTATQTLFLAFELGRTAWGRAFGTVPAAPPRRVTIPARDRAGWAGLLVVPATLRRGFRGGKSGGVMELQKGKDLQTPR
jgi:hypothetical protein